jgi:hypothetical protein
MTSTVEEEVESGIRTSLVEVLVHPTNRSDEVSVVMIVSCLMTVDCVIVTNEVCTEVDGSMAIEVLITTEVVVGAGGEDDGSSVGALAGGEGEDTGGGADALRGGGDSCREGSAGGGGGCALGSSAVGDWPTIGVLGTGVSSVPFPLPLPLPFARKSPASPPLSLAPLSCLFPSADLRRPLPFELISFVRARVYSCLLRTILEDKSGQVYRAISSRPEGSSDRCPGWQEHDKET